MNRELIRGLAVLGLTAALALQAEPGGRFGRDGRNASAELDRDKSEKWKNKKVFAGRKKVGHGRSRHFHQKRVMVPPRPHYRPIKVRGRHYYHRHGAFFRWSPAGFIAVRAPIGAIVASLPIGCIELAIGGSIFHYYEGVYYRRMHRGYRIVEAPAGVYLSAPPLGAHLVIIGGRRYRVLEGVYYRELSDGYIIEHPPEEPSQTAPLKADTVYVEKFYHRIMVRNSNGSESPVDLEKVGENTWKGPRGELYHGLPDNEALRQVYGF